MKTLLLTLLSAAAVLAQSFVPGPGNVALTLDDYNRLLEMAAKPAKPADAPPVPFAIRSARFNLVVNKESVGGAVAFEGEVFAPGTVKAPLLGGMIVTGSEMRGRDLPLTREGGIHTAILTGPAEFAIALQIEAPLVIEPGRASFTVAAPAAGAVRLTVSLPGEETQVRLSAGLITSRVSRDGRTIVEATLMPGQPATMTWDARLPAPPPAAPKETRFLSDVKTVVSLSDTDVTCASLVEITVVQGEPGQFRIQLPAGFQAADVTGPTLSSWAPSSDAVLLTVGSPTLRAHQFLIVMTRAAAGASADVPLPAFSGAQRETGEVVIEAEGAIEIKAGAKGGLRRMDLRETSDSLRAMSRGSMHAAFRYLRRAAEEPVLSLEWSRFPETSVLAATAQTGVVTTLVTSEGRSLTEVKLTVHNVSQQFLKVVLPAGASIASAEVAGEKVKPVSGADGDRVPLLRPGFRPSNAYEVSFVYTHAGAPFVKSGAAAFDLPKMDVPVGVLQWEVFLPQQYRVSDFGGDAIPAELIPAIRTHILSLTPAAGLLSGIVTDAMGAVIANARVSITHETLRSTWNATADANGRWTLGNIPSGRLRVTVNSPGFRIEVRIVEHDAARGTALVSELQVGAITESVEVTAQAPQIQNSRRQNAAPADLTASANVATLQSKVAGVLPIAMNIPKAGNSYRFVRPLVVDETTRLTFRYRRK